MKKLFDPLFILYCFLWCLVHFLRQMHFILPGVNDYMTDFLFVPVMAHLAVHFTRTYIVRSSTYQYPFVYLLFISCYASVVFEWIMPKVSGVYTDDIFDVLAYFTGSVFYYCIHQKGKQTSNPTGKSKGP